MSWLGSIFAGDEELGKKDDDHRPSNGVSSSQWLGRKPIPARRKRPILYGLCALLLLYVFVKNIPTDLGPARRYPLKLQDDREGSLHAGSNEIPTNKPKRPATPSEAEEHYHNGPIKFYSLASSLHGVARLGGQHELNKNVLFAASNLKSASELLPLACEMAVWERNDVHFAIMGRDDMDLAEIKKINGVEEWCDIHWHDARPDYSRWSSDFRMEVSVTASVDYMHTFIHPQIIIIDDPNREDTFFVSAIRSKAMDIGRGLIELPPDAMETMMWLTRLDSGSLAAWTATYVDILIQAPPESSGSLVRLLRSIENADYFCIRRPHLTIELPTDIDPPTWRYLENLVWPPLDGSGTPHASQVTLRHRVKRRTSTEHEASARLVESFYPVRTGSSHVLLLSPQVELSPLFYHYVIYHLLEYKYSAYAASNTPFPNLVGFSLELPSYHLNDSEPLEPPLLERTPFRGRERNLPGESTPFLWQAPNANAALYFGDKWMEFHSFLSARLTKPPASRRKVFSEKHPSWLEFLLELIRARGYSMLYPNFPGEGDAIVAVHDELYQVPEEYGNASTDTAPPVPELNPSEPIIAENTKKSRSPPPNSEHNLLESNLLSLLPNNGDLPAVGRLPLVSYNGIEISSKVSHEAATSFAETYRREIGTCRTIEETTPREANSALDLFCHLDEIYDPLKPKRPTDSSAGSNGGAYGIQPVPDLDTISAEHQENARQEALAHIARQGGKSLPVRPETAPNRTPMPQPQQDHSPETQNEFQLQMQRQAKAQDAQTEATPAGAVGEMKEEIAAGIPALEPAPEAASISPDLPKQSEVQASAPEPAPSHDGFTKQPPPKIIEDPKAEAAQAKEPGW